MSRTIKPLVVDQAVYERIRPMEARDAARVAELHHAAMGNSLWARLGLKFLTRLYEELVEDPAFRAFVYEHDDGVVRGFIAGTTNAESMLGDTFKRRPWRFVRPTLSGLRRDPSVLKPLLQTAQYFARSSGDLGVEVPAESLFCSFEPVLRGKRVSGAINKVLFDQLLHEGHQAVKVTTEIDNQGANRQLTSWGFEDKGRFEFYGKNMVTYVLDLPGCPRLEDKDWRH